MSDYCGDGEVWVDVPDDAPAYSEMFPWEPVTPPVAAIKPYTEEQWTEIERLIEAGQKLEAQQMMLRIQTGADTDP